MKDSVLALDTEVEGGRVSQGRGREVGEGEGRVSQEEGEGVRVSQGEDKGRNY